ncbi:hypothetical protein [Emiliania huxleyi virus 99B1]|nr:hypothetical protein [Emiliania huxleyi virus 99B1]|mmetsp:Transcript_26208/g.76004  ORF Transcript_26208/g.76004 Transcript_26208/m.76004 type:complete len:592 (+) Transcript_26208:3121-4896(+)
MFENADIVSVLITEMFNTYNDTRYGIGSPYYKLLHTLNCVNKTFKENTKFGIEQSALNKSNIYNKIVNNGAETMIYDRINGKRKLMKQYKPPSESHGLSRQYVNSVLLNRLFDSHPAILTMDASLTYLNKNAIIYNLPVDSVYDVIKYGSLGPCPEIIIVHMMRSILSALATLHSHNVTHGYVTVSTIYMTTFSESGLPSFYLSYFDKSLILNNPHTTNDIVNVAEIALAFLQNDMDVIPTYNAMINEGVTFNDFYEHTCNVSVFCNNIKTTETKYVHRNRSLMRVLYKILCSRYSDTITAHSILTDLVVFDHPVVMIPSAPGRILASYTVDFVGDPFIRHGFTTALDKTGRSMWTYASELLVKFGHFVEVSFHITLMQQAVQIMYNFMHTVDVITLDNVPNLCNGHSTEEAKILLISTIALSCLSLSSKINHVHATWIYKACNAEWAHKSFGMNLEITPEDICKMEGVILNNIDSYVYLHKLPISVICSTLKKHYADNNPRIWTRGSAALLKHVSTAVMVYTPIVDFSTTSPIIAELTNICTNIGYNKKTHAPITHAALSSSYKHPYVISTSETSIHTSVSWLLTRLTKD